MTHSAPDLRVDAPGAPGPVAAGERFGSLDTLRGVAILGILVMNIYAFAMPLAAYTNPTLWGGTEWYNLGTWFVTHVVFEAKFISIFAILFGAGIVLMTDRAESRGGRPAAFFYRRQLWLALIGALHAYLIWMGDILFTYALIGMLAYLFRKRQPRTLLIIATCLLPVTILMGFGNAQQIRQTIDEVGRIELRVEAGETLGEEDAALLEDWRKQKRLMMPGIEDVQADIDAYRGDYVSIVRHRAPEVAMLQAFVPIFYGVWRVGALMLIGMALMKTGILTGERSPAFYRRAMFVTYAIGLPLSIFSAVDLYAHRFDPLYTMAAGGIANYFGSLAMALGHSALVLWLAASGAFSALLARFAAVGRMALSNYLMHSLLLTPVFYGYGLGLYGTIPRFWQMGFVVVVIGLQLWLSSWWLARYRFGPAEWAWRSLTYMTRQPMRR